MTGTSGSLALVLLLLLTAVADQCTPERPPVPQARAGDPATAPFQAPGDSAIARDALERYWGHLAAGEWEDAARLYGGDWRESAGHWVEPEAADTVSTAGFLARMCGAC